MKPSYNSNKIVAIINGLGDNICASVAFELFHKLFPYIDLHLITWQGIFAESQRYNPHLKAVYGIGGQPHEQANWALQNGFNTNEIVILDHIINWARFLDVNVAAKANESINIPPHILQAFINNYHSIYDPISWWYKSLRIFNLNLVESYAIQLCGELPPSDMRPKFYCCNEDYKYAEQLKEFSPSIVINHSTGSNRSNKEWGAANWFSLINLILDSYPKFNIISVGQPDDLLFPFDKPKVLRLRQLRDTGIREIYPIVKQAVFYIASQSGLSHLFDCSDTPGVQISIGGPSNIVANRYGKVTVIDQLNLFDPSSVSLEMVWNVVKRELEKLNV